MSFSPAVKNEAIRKSRRSCCVCQEFAGRSIQVHHITPESEGGLDDIENAIVLCLRCHAEAGHYNPAHPIGTRYSREELRRQRDEWWIWCAQHPFAPLHKSPVSVSPTSVTLRTGPWSQKSTVKIHNKTDNVYYQVIVKCIVDSSVITSEYIGIEPKKKKEELVATVGSYTLLADTFRLGGINRAGQAVIFLWIASIDPLETLTFILTNHQNYKSPDTATAKLNLEICDLSEEPLNLAFDPEKQSVGLPFTLPEDFRITSFSVTWA